jgi:hypothetical protein
MMRRLSIAMAALCLGTAPALAYPSCLAGGGPGLRIEFGASFGTGKFSEQDDMDFLLLQARSRGINADTAERTWLDCVKITRRENGRWVTEYYDPRTWRLVE